MVFGALALLSFVTIKTFQVSRAAAPKGTKSCRTQGESVQCNWRKKVLIRACPVHHVLIQWPIFYSLLESLHLNALTEFSSRCYEQVCKNHGKVEHHLASNSGLIKKNAHFAVVHSANKLTRHPIPMMLMMEVFLESHFLSKQPPTLSYRKCMVNNAALKDVWAKTINSVP